MQSIQNLGLAVIAIAAGSILDSRGYLFLEIFLSACVCCKYELSSRACVLHVEGSTFNPQPVQLKVLHGAGDVKGLSWRPGMHLPVTVVHADRYNADLSVL